MDNHVSMRLLPLLLALFQGQSSDYPVFETDLLSPVVAKSRRERLKAALPPNSVALILTNPWRNRSNDTDFRFRGASNFLYLTGFNEPDSALLLAPSGIDWNGKRVTELLFVNVSNPASETWECYRMGPVNAQRLVGVEMAVDNRQFGDVLKTIPVQPWAINAPPEASGMIERFQNQFASWHGANEAAKASLAGELGRMRVRKDATEIRLLRKAADATVAGHREAMKSVEPGMREFELQAVVEYAFTKAGCEFQGYNSIVGSGPNACILHYEANRKEMKAGEIICMDVAGEFHGYTADVTRSFPVSGKFSPEQKAVYEVVLEAQKAGIAACVPGAKFGAAHAAATKVIAAGLKRLGIIKESSEVGRYFMHGTSHYIGLDVHDSMGDDTLQPNYVLTVEPGIYIKAGSPCDKKWWNIGIRIEDDILVTEKGPENLSQGVPREVKEIEALMKAKGLGNVPIGR